MNSAFDFRGPFPSGQFEPSIELKKKLDEFSAKIGQTVRALENLVSGHKLGADKPEAEQRLRDLMQKAWQQAEETLQKWNQH